MVLDVMTQLGHTDPDFTLRVYGHAMRRDEGARERLKALREGPIPAQKGTGALLNGSRTASTSPRKAETAPQSRHFLRWARRVSNLRPLACEASALPLSYAPCGSAV